MITSTMQAFDITRTLLANTVKPDEDEILDAAEKAIQAVGDGLVELDTIEFLWKRYCK